MVPKMLIIVMLVGSACAACYEANPPKKPKEFENKEGCYVKVINDVIPYGTNVTAPGECYRIRCLDQDTVEYTSCGDVIYSANENCHSVQDFSKPFPDCCSYFECTDGTP